MSEAGVDGLLAILGDSGLTRGAGAHVPLARVCEMHVPS